MDEAVISFIKNISFSESTNVFGIYKKHKKDDY
jgi:hypothetical protein